MDEQAEEYLNHQRILNKSCTQPKRFTKLSCIIKLFQLKVCQKQSDILVKIILLKEMLPKGETTRHGLQQKIIIEDLRFNYNKIDACPCYCIFYQKEKRSNTVSNRCADSRCKTALSSGRDVKAKGLNKKCSCDDIMIYPYQPETSKAIRS